MIFTSAACVLPFSSDSKINVEENGPRPAPNVIRATSARTRPTDVTVFSLFCICTGAFCATLVDIRPNAISTAPALAITLDRGLLSSWNKGHPRDARTSSMSNGVVVRSTPIEKHASTMRPTFSDTAHKLQTRRALHEANACFFGHCEFLACSSAVGHVRGSLHGSFLDRFPCTPGRGEIQERPAYPAGVVMAPTRIQVVEINKDNRLALRRGATKRGPPKMPVLSQIVMKINEIRNGTLAKSLQL